MFRALVLRRTFIALLAKLSVYMDVAGETINASYLSKRKRPVLGKLLPASLSKKIKDFLNRLRRTSFICDRLHFSLRRI